MIDFHAWLTGKRKIPRAPTVRLTGRKDDVSNCWPREFEDLLRSNCRFAGDRAEIDPDVPLSVLGADSLAVVELIVGIEDAFDLSIPMELLTPQVFATPGTIWETVGMLISERGTRRPG